MKYAAATAAKSFQSCPTLCDPIDGRGNIREVKIKTLLGNSHLIKRPETSYQQIYQGLVTWKLGIEKLGFQS